MKRTLAVTLITLVLSFVAVGFASASECTCGKFKSTTDRPYDPMNDIP